MIKMKGLGRGLDALLSGNDKPHGDDQRNLPVERLRPGKYQPRTHMDEASLAELAASIKDRAENLMIVDLMRNDLSRVCVTGSVEVPRLLEVEEHPGLVHLVSEVGGTLVPGATWSSILGATFPPGSVTGAPKSSALRLIEERESVSRSFYCGALGWVDNEGQSAELAVTIRTFWRDGTALRFGTGAGITWESDPAAEWRETELKARRLIDLASEGEA